MLQIKNLTKTYPNAPRPALNDVSLTINKGEFVALLGPNGAGKTTLINTLVGNVEKSGGSVTIGGHDLETDPLATKYVLGVVPQEVSFDSFFTVNEMLLNQSGYFGVNNNQPYIDELLNALGLMDKKHANTRTLSGGMKRRLLIAKALVHKPQLFILDEPTAGVDIELRRSTYTYLQKLQKMGITMILTTHYLEEAELLCDRVVVISEGQIIADKPKKELMQTLGKKVEIELTVRDIPSPMPQSLRGYAWKTGADTMATTVEKANLSQLLADTHEHLDVQDYAIKEPKLEDIFLHLVTS